ncbi:hypothetical protein BGX27_000039 [Mortierella sp. AM989]|nr:hypothetical protein BGX27_000039 [Mortierella sp. AM989]
MPRANQSSANYLSREVDVYSDWVDACEEANTSERIEQEMAKVTIRGRSCTRAQNEDSDRIPIRISMERPQVRPQDQGGLSTATSEHTRTRVRSQSMNRLATLTTITTPEQQLQKWRERHRELDQTHVQVKGKMLQTPDDLSWDYSVLDRPDIEGDSRWNNLVDDQGEVDDDSDMDFGD